MSDPQRYPDLTPHRRASLCRLLGEVRRLHVYALQSAPKVAESCDSLARAVERQFPEMRFDQCEVFEDEGPRTNADLRASLRVIVQDVAAEAREALEVVEGVTRGK